ncbi:hypothetical protein FRC11_002274, partial [Ceratobasidium sp. 423]
NVIIGANQAEGIHCKGSCNVYNVWFEDICEDAITLRQKSGTSNIVGGGAKGATDKVIQHNGGGIVNIDSYCVRDFGKLYRSCGNCKTQYKRTVNISNVIAKNGKLLAGINSNYYLTSHGYSLALGDISSKQQGLKQVADECIESQKASNSTHELKVCYGPCDVSIESQVELLAEKAVSELGGIDVVSGLGHPQITPADLADHLLDGRKRRNI